MTTPAKKRGYVGNVYLNAGSHAVPNWNQVEDAGDIKISDSWKKFEAPNRISNVIKYLPSMQDWGVEFKMCWDSSSADQLALRAAYRAGTPIDIWAADGPSGTSGTSGPNAEWLVDEFSSDMPLVNGMEVHVKLCPHANCSFEPTYLATA